MRDERRRRAAAGLPLASQPQASWARLNPHSQVNGLNPVFCLGRAYHMPSRGALRKGDLSCGSGGGALNRTRRNLQSLLNMQVRAFRKPPKHVGQHWQCRADGRLRCGIPTPSTVSSNHSAEHNLAERGRDGNAQTSCIFTAESVHSCSNWPSRQHRQSAKSWRIKNGWAGVPGAAERSSGCR